MCLLVHGSRRRRETAATLKQTLIGWILAVTLLSATVAGQTTSWVIQPSDKNVTVGSTVEFQCQITTSSGERMLLWNSGVKTLFINGVKNGDNVPDRYSVIGNTSLGQNNLRITDVRESDDAFYSCNVFQFDSVQVKLTVLLPPGPPEITSNSSSSTLVENTVITYTCSSRGGKPAPTIIWLRNGQPVNSAVVTLPNAANGNITSSQITWTLSRDDHSANYTCVVSNAANQNAPLVKSEILNVQYSPHVHFEPRYEPYSVKLGSPVTLRCVVDSNPTYNSLEWTKDGMPISVPSDTKSFSSVEKFHHGNYSCRATNIVSGRTRESTAYVLLNVIYAPVVTPPAPVTTNVSSMVNLSCNVVANPPPTEIRWDKLGPDPVTRLGPNFVFSAEKRYAGNYSCTAKSRLQPSEGQAEDVATKGETKVIVQYKPGRASISPVASAVISQRIVLQCTIDDPGVPAPVYEWWRQDNPSLILQSNTSPDFVIPAAVLEHNGQYTCRPKNIMGFGTPDTIQVEVNAPPIFTQSIPSDSTYRVPITQSSLFLQHTIEGRPQPTVMWLKDGTPLSAYPNLYSVETTHTQEQYKFTVVTRLTFVGSGRDQNRLRIDDIGNYTCQVSSDAAASPTIKSTRLSIQFAPSVTASSRVATNIGEMATLKCASRANPTPTFHWYRSGQRVSNGSRVTISQSATAGIASYEGYLQIRSVEATDFGIYECEATNDLSQDRKALNLSHTDKPEAPSDLRITEQTWESVRLQWSPGFDGGYSQQFHIAYHSIHGNKTTLVYPQGVTFFNVTRLLPQTSYTFSVHGENKLGKGANSNKITSQTKVLVFPALNSVPEFHVEGKRLSVPNELDQAYCLRVDVSVDGQRTWTVAEQCAPAEGGEIALDRAGATNVNVSICLVYRPEVCGEPVSCKISQETTPDLTKTQVIIIGCVCAAILTVLLIILVYIVCRRRQKNKNYQNDPHSPRAVQQGNGAVPNQKPRSFDNPDGVVYNARNGYPVQYLTPADSFPMGDTSYDSQFDKHYEYDMHRHNASNTGDHQYYSEKPGDISFNGSPRTPTKDPGQFINVPENHTKEGGSFGSGNESGYSTPDKQKPKKVIYEVVV